MRSGIASRSNSPGVGSYKLTLGDAIGPKYGFGTSCRQFLINNNAPGPGTYELSKSFVNRDHGATMISRRNDNSFMSVKNSPGPFEYKPDKVLSKAAIRFGRSHREDASSRSHSKTP